MKVAIAGAGLTGSYLYRLLVSQGHGVHLFDKRPGTKCGVTPCAWGTSRGFAELAKAAGLDASRYVLTRSDHIVMDGLRIRADLTTFDKKKFIEDLRQGAHVDYSEPDLREYDRLIDSTGVERAFLPPIRDDVVLRCVQYRIKTDVPLANEVRLRGIGYAWCFPLSNKEFHVGCGSLLLDPRRVIEELGWAGDSSSRGGVLCACKGSVRLSGPQRSLPFVADGNGREVWGVGEAIGCVAPLAGDGIIPGMRSVQLLMEFWDDPAAYTKAILREFGWMKDERGVIDKLRSNEELGLQDAWVLKKNSRRMAMQVGLKQAATLMKHLSR